MTTWFGSIPLMPNQRLVCIKIPRGRMNFIEEIIEAGDKEKLRFRFPPEPNGTLHIGHAKAIVLNFGLAEKYGAPCNLRMDDTNPLAESEENVNGILRDIEWLGYDFSGNLRRTSNYLHIIKDYAEKLISLGKAYMDLSTSEEIADGKGTPSTPGTNSPYRDNSVEENLKLWEEIFTETSTTKGVLRAKVDMADPNMHMRDPVIYRNIPGHGMYPMYDFAHPLSDYLEEITHSLCTLEFEVHRPFYEWVLDTLELEGVKPRQIEFSRLNMSHTIMSKRNIKRLIEEGKVAGWDDPRLPTISGLRERGFTPGSIREFCDRVGVTKFNAISDFAFLESILRDELNAKANRMMVVGDPIKLKIMNLDAPLEVEVDNNPEDPSVGTRKLKMGSELWIEREDFRADANRKYHRLKIKDGHYVRLKGGVVVEAVGYKSDVHGVVEEVYCSVIDNPDKVKTTIHWVDCESAVNVILKEYEPLFLAKEPGKATDDFMDDLNPSSLVTKLGYGEPGIDSIESGDRLQFLRKGYYISKSKHGANIFYKTVGLKSSFKE